MTFLVQIVSSPAIVKLPIVFLLLCFVMDTINWVQYFKIFVFIYWIFRSLAITDQKQSNRKFLVACAQHQKSSLNYLETFFSYFSLLCSVFVLAEVQEVVDPVLYLLSDKSTMITGTILPVDGGFTACWSGVSQSPELVLGSSFDNINWYVYCLSRAWENVALHEEKGTLKTADSSKQIRDQKEIQVGYTRNGIERRAKTVAGLRTK